MQLRAHFFLIVVGVFYFSEISQASDLRRSILFASPQETSIAPFLPIVLTKNILCTSSSGRLDKAEQLRKGMRIDAMVQHSWISSMVVPGLGQVYNKDYWKVPFIYLGFTVLSYRIYLEHKEMNRHKRIKLTTTIGSIKQDLPCIAFTEKRIQDCERTRDLFIIIATAWYLLNILDAYAHAHDRTVNFKDDIVVATPAL